MSPTRLTTNIIQHKVPLFAPRRPSIVEWYDEEHKFGGPRTVCNPNSGPHKYSTQVYLEMKQHFDNVQLINMDEPSTADLTTQVYTTDIMAHVYCNMLPNATESCLWRSEKQP